MSFIYTSGPSSYPGVGGPPNPGGGGKGTPGGNPGGRNPGGAPGTPPGVNGTGGPAKAGGPAVRRCNTVSDYRSRLNKSTTRTGRYHSHSTPCRHPATRASRGLKCARKGKIKMVLWKIGAERKVTHTPFF